MWLISLKSLAVWKISEIKEKGENKMCMPCLKVLTNRNSLMTFWLVRRPNITVTTADVWRCRCPQLLECYCARIYSSITSSKLQPVWLCMGRRTLFGTSSAHFGERRLSLLPTTDWTPGPGIGKELRADLSPLYPFVWGRLFSSRPAPSPPLLRSPPLFSFPS